MRNNFPASRPLNLPDANDQMRLPFDDPDDELPPEDFAPVTSIHPLKLTDRNGRHYEMVVRQSPYTGAVLAYCLRPMRLI